MDTKVHIKRIWMIRAYLLVVAVAVLLLNVLRWTAGGH